MRASSLLHRSHTKRHLIRLGLTWHHKALARYSRTFERDHDPAGVICYDVDVWAEEPS